MKIENLEINESDGVIILNNKTYRAESEKVMSDMERNVKDVIHTVQFCIEYNVHIHTKTSEQFDAVLNIYLKHNPKDRSENMWIGDTCQTTIHFNNSKWLHSTVDDCRKRNYTIISAERFIKDNSPALILSKDEIGIDLYEGEDVYVRKSNGGYTQWLGENTQWNEQAKAAQRDNYKHGYRYFKSEKEREEYSHNLANQPATVEQAEPKWESEFEILSFDYEGSTNLYVKYEKGYAQYAHMTFGDVETLLKDSSASIHSIRRKSDQAVFTVGDKAKYGNFTIQIDSIALEGNPFRIMSEGELFDISLCHPYTEPALPTLQEVFKKVQPNFYLDVDNSIEEDDEGHNGNAYNQNKLSQRKQVEQVRSWFALRNIADYYNGEVGWMPTENYYAIGIDLKVHHRGISCLHLMEVPFKTGDHAEAAISILKEAGLLNALKG